MKIKFGKSINIMSFVPNWFLVLVFTGWEEDK
jgi:hypothetical protein